MIDPAIAAAEYAVFLFSTICHEAAHANAAYRMGDDTAAKGGQVSLDPIPHIKREPFGMVLIPLLGLFTGGYIMGWASTPYDPRWAARYPKRAAGMALAGPLANFTLVLVAALIIHGGMLAGIFTEPESADFSHVVGLTADAPGWAGGLAVLASILFSLNLLLFIFNLIPVAPLDGASALGLIPGAEGLSAALRSPRFRFVGLLVAFYGFQYIYEPIHTVALDLLYPGAHFH